MKNWLYIIYIGLMGCLVSSCRQSLDEEVQLPVTTGKAQITFTIALDDIGSRATWEENESSGIVGTDMENAIDLTSENGLQVFVYDSEWNYLAEVTNKEVRRILTNEYKFTGQLEIDDFDGATLECGLMVYANCKSGNQYFDYNAEYIPMWGVKQTTLQLAKGELTQIAEPIYLLRSMAKVEVKLDESIADDFDLTSVTVDKYNGTGFVIPAYTTLVDTEDMDDEAVFHPYASPRENLSFSEITEDVFTVYLPEYDNSTNPATVSVVIDGKTYTIEFKDYVDGSATGDAYSIVRNHYYQYTITSVSPTETAMEVLISINSWNKKKHEYGETDLVQ